jgi:hypothetical protein
VATKKTASGRKVDKNAKSRKASKPAAKRPAKRSKSVVDNNAPPEAVAASPEAQAAAQQQATAEQQQTNISTSRGFVDFLVTNRLSIALTSYQTGQLMLIGPLLDGRLSVFQRNFVRAMGLWASPQRLYLSTIAQIWRLENVLGAGQLPPRNNFTMNGFMCLGSLTQQATSMRTNSASTRMIS